MPVLGTAGDSARLSLAGFGTQLLREGAGDAWERAGSRKEA